MSGPAGRRAQPVDYDEDLERFLTNQHATRLFAAEGDLHESVAERLAQAVPRGRALDVGGGNGLLARSLAHRGVSAVVLDQAHYVRSAPSPSVQADALAVPFVDGSFDAVAALWMLYHLDDPVLALQEAARVLRGNGVFVACAPSRRNDPELRDVLPGWGEPSTFDAEDAVDIIDQVFEVVDVQRWDAPLVSLPTADAMTTFLHGRGLSPTAASLAAAQLPVPLDVTKRGALIWARTRPGRKAEPTAGAQRPRVGEVLNTRSGRGRASTTNEAHVGPGRHLGTSGTLGRASR